VSVILNPRIVWCNFLQIRLDHRSQSVSFGTDLNVCLQEDVEEGPFLQHMPGEQLRNQLQHMARALSNAITKLQADQADKVIVCHFRQTNIIEFLHFCYFLELFMGIIVFS